MQDYKKESKNKYIGVHTAQQRTCMEVNCEKTTNKSWGNAKAATRKVIVTSFHSLRGEVGFH
jgi:hypothetical protein